MCEEMMLRTIKSGLRNGGGRPPGLLAGQGDSVCKHERPLKTNGLSLVLDEEQSQLLQAQLLPQYLQENDDASDV